MTCLDLEKHTARLEEDGYTIIPDVLPKEEIEASKRAIDEVLGNEAPIARQYGLQNEDLEMAFNAQGKHPHIWAMPLRYPNLIRLFRRVLGEDMFAHNVTIRKPLPTGKKNWSKLGGNLHADWPQFTVDPFVGGRHYPMALQSVWAISEFSVKSGATYLWPRSHLKNEVPPEEPHTLPPGWIQAVAPAGSVLVWDSALWHTSAPNSSEDPRYSLVFYFHRWWLKGFNDAYRLVPPEVREAMTDEQRHFWGLKAAVPPNTHFRGMDEQQIQSLTSEEKAILNIAAF